MGRVLTRTPWRSMSWIVRPRTARSWLYRSRNCITGRTSFQNCMLQKAQIVLRFLRHDCSTGRSSRVRRTGRSLRSVTGNACCATRTSTRRSSNSFQADIDALLAETAPEVLEQFNAVYRRLREVSIAAPETGTQEELAQALASCRRILKAVADRVSPPSAEGAEQPD